MTTATTKDQYLELLQKHDWSYEYSDDHKVYTRGRNERCTLERLAADHDPALKLWNTYAPSDYKKLS